ncbi:flavin reductase family protein [Mesorhizobium sp. M7A.F.Ce.TU.012.03.2.1]|uniref:flavin reductase family protein n=1 Tax=Mesorhizobium sp. M7A.F.Ce.TU.012.03.2.1 TaxID=2493681 RepID=UPI001AEC80F3|nr:flavin reductase family protein [Mesorhizobium sp. M7A.F.Ce.TU.012.03.2.1]
MDTNDAFREAMGRFAGAVNIITTEEGGLPSGLIATAVCSLSFDPPSVLVCINKSASSHDTILRRGIFAVNLLSPALSNVARRFQSQKGSDRFEKKYWVAGKTGAPLLLGAPMALDCKLSHTHDGFSHSILIGVVTDVQLGEGDSHNSLLWQGRRYHKPMEYVELIRRPADVQMIFEEMLF